MTRIRFAGVSEKRRIKRQSRFDQRICDEYLIHQSFVNYCATSVSWVESSSRPECPRSAAGQRPTDVPRRRPVLTPTHTPDAPAQCIRPIHALASVLLTRALKLSPQGAGTRRFERTREITRADAHGWTSRVRSSRRLEAQARDVLSAPARNGTREKRARARNSARTRYAREATRPGRRDGRRRRRDRG